jgi:hypothetical protein
MTKSDSKTVEQAEKLREDIIARLKEVEKRIKSVQEKLNERNIPDMKEDFLNFKDIDLFNPNFKSTQD